MTTHDAQASTPRIFKCTHHESSSSRNLVVCIDGTSNQFGVKNTNIVELYSHITKNDRQLTYYSSGLGTIAKATGASLRHRLSSGLDMVFGRKLQRVIMASYRWLSDNYQDGDRIFLFGFSRGAYQVRALAGMIAQVGLLLPGNNEQIPFAFDLYSKTDDDDSSLIEPASIFGRSMAEQSRERTKYSDLAKTFQKTFCRSHVCIHFVGVWDTVSSVGIGRSRTLPCTTTSCEHICYFRHALALDERRVKYLPEYVYGGRSSSRDDGRIKEVWFAGCHSDVGGGNRRNEKLQSGDIPLLWMRGQAATAGLEMEPADVMWKIDDLNKQITHSLTFVWWSLELMPLKRLLYYDSDRHTSRPHFGDPRRILSGQKVHVSVLFKNNYKPYAQFYNIPMEWPEPMFWNDVTSHQRLQNLPDIWEKDIFDDGFVWTLLNDLKRDQSILDALDRLAFLASFDAYKSAFSVCQDAKQILATFLESRDRLVRLSTAATYGELGWAWPSKTPSNEFVPQILEDVSELFKSSKDCRRACMWMPSLYKQPDLKAELLSDGNLRMLVQLCDNTRISKHEEGTSTVVFHSAQALSMLMKLDDEFARRLIDLNLVGDITEALHSNCSPALVAVLSVVDGLARDDPVSMKSGPIVATLLGLVKRFDDFVAPAATRVLCSLLPEDDLRKTMLDFGALSTLFDMLDQCSAATKRVACHALDKFVQHADVRHMLLEDGYLDKLAKRAQSHLPIKRDGAIIALVAFGSTPVKTAVMRAIMAAKTIPALIGRLGRKSTALSATSALARLVKINDVAEMVSADESGAARAITDMLQNRWFDGLQGEDGLQVLSELLECELLRSTVLSASIDVLGKMINSGRYESTYAGLHYLRVIAKFDGSLPPSREMKSLVLPVVNVLRAPQRRAQRIAMEALRFFSAEEELRAAIVDGLLCLLEDRRASVVFAASTVLGFLARDRSVCDRVLMEEKFWNMSRNYYDGLNLEYGSRNGGPSTGEVYASVGHLIKLVQAQESDKAGAMCTDDQWINNGWFVPMPYEPRKEDRAWVAALSRFLPILLLSGTGQRGVSGATG